MKKVLTGICVIVVLFSGCSTSEKVAYVEKHTTESGITNITPTDVKEDFGVTVSQDTINKEIDKLEDETGTEITTIEETSEEPQVGVVIPGESSQTHSPTYSPEIQSEADAMLAKFFGEDTVATTEVREDDYPAVFAINHAIKDCALKEKEEVENNDKLSLRDIMLWGYDECLTDSLINKYIDDGFSALPIEGVKNKIECWTVTGCRIGASGYYGFVELYGEGYKVRYQEYCMRCKKYVDKEKYKNADLSTGMYIDTFICPRCEKEQMVYLQPFYIDASKYITYNRR